MIAPPNLCLHISDEEVRRDIADTEREIEQLEHMQAAEQELARWHIQPEQRRIYEVKAGARAHGITERRAFIAKLHTLLARRKEAAS